jgi:hypothetical protein
VTVRRLLGAARMMPVLLGGLVLVTAGPAAACTCLSSRSEAERAARADAVFVGTLASHVIQVDHKARRLMASPDPAVAWRGFRNDSTHSVWTFQVSRVYKGTVGERQEIVAPPGAPGGSNCSGVGGLQHPGTEPLVVFAYNSGGHRYRPKPGQYASNMCSGSRPLAGGGEPVLGGLQAHAPGGPNRSLSPGKASPSSPSRMAATSGRIVATGTSSSNAPFRAPAGLPVGVAVLVAGVAAGLGLALVRARRRASPD